MDKKIRIGVMGCADIAQRLVIPAIQQLGEKFKLVAVYKQHQYHHVTPMYYNPQLIHKRIYQQNFLLYQLSY